MSFDVDLSIEGLQEIQEANLRAIAVMQPETGLGRAVQYMLPDVHRYAVAVTHVDTGALRASHRMEIAENTGNSTARGLIFIDPSAINPRSKQRTSIYGVYEHARGGEHAFYERTVVEHGANVAERGMQFIQRMLDGNG